jgi:hypothetical protein
MKRRSWEQERQEREKHALSEHARLSALFKENRFIFEQERKRMIEEVINSARDEEQKKRLRALQESWDKKMKGAGSVHNRFVLAQTIFWEHFHEVWHPTIKNLNSTLNGTPNHNK